MERESSEQVTRVGPEGGDEGSGEEGRAQRQGQARGSLDDFVKIVECNQDTPTWGRVPLHWVRSHWV